MSPWIDGAWRNEPVAEPEPVQPAWLEHFYLTELYGDPGVGCILCAWAEYDNGTPGSVGYDLRNLYALVREHWKEKHA